MDETPAERIGCTLSDLRDWMHNWFWVGVGYDWGMNPEHGKVWQYQDCAKTLIKATTWEEFERLVREYMAK